MEFKKCLKKLRIDNNLTQEELGKKLGISGKVVSKWESGYTIPDITKIKALCEVFNCEYEDLIGPERKQKSKEKEDINKVIEKEKTEQKLSLCDGDYKSYKILSKVLYILTKICRIAMYVLIPFIVLGMIFIPSIISRIEIKEDVVSFRSFDNNVYSISLKDVRLNGEYTVRNGDDIVSNTVNFDLLKRISNSIDKTSKTNIITNVEITFVVMFISVVLSIIILYNLEELFKSLYEKETPFTKENISYLGTSASLMIASLICNYVISIFISNITSFDIGYDLNLINIIEIMSVFVLIYIFKYGYNMQKVTNGKIYNQE